MVSDEQTRVVRKRLMDAGFEPARSSGSQTVWHHPSGTSITVPDGRKTISAGVVRKVNKAIAEVNT